MALPERSHNYQELLSSIKTLMDKARANVSQSVNTILISTYWQIGEHIVEYEQQGNEKAEYGSQLLTKLSRDLSFQYGKGFSKSNIYNMRRLYLVFSDGHQEKSNEENPIFQTSSGKFPSTILHISYKLTWSHYLELLKISDPLEISFYQKETELEKWNVRELRRQIKSMLFHRIALNKDKEHILQLANKGIEIEKPEDIIKDPYVLEFAGIPDRPIIEKDIEDAIMSNLSRFLLELGKGFAFVGRQYRFSIAGRHYFVDLVFYNVILKCYCLIDLKQGEVQHEDIGQMNFYLNYFRKEVCTEGDNEPVGIVLGASADRLTMEYAMDNISNQLFVSRYQLYLPDRETLENELRRILQANNAENK